MGASVGAVLAYVASHLMRYARLRVLFQEQRPSAVRLADAHIASAWISAILPFRLGELVRAWRFVAVAGRWRIGVAAYAMEKFFDAVVLLTLVVLAMLGRTPTTQLVPLAALLAAVGGGGLLTYALADGVIDRSARRMLFAAPSPRTTRQLRGVAQVRQLVAAVRSTVRQRGVLLLGLTAGIWLLDGVAFLLTTGLAAHGAAPGWASFLATLQRMLGGTLALGSGLYARMVVTVLSVGAAGCALAWAWRHLPRLLTRTQPPRPYRLVPVPLAAPDE